MIPLGASGSSHVNWMDVAERGSVLGGACSSGAEHASECECVYVNVGVGVYEFCKNHSSH